MSFKYYIHDSNASLRFELVGSLTAVDVPELRGCWETAKPTLAERDLVLDVKALEQRDEAGNEWVRSMVAQGAKLLEQAAAADQRGVKNAFTRKLAQSATQAQ